jgi:hypothetical protein
MSMPMTAIPELRRDMACSFSVPRASFKHWRGWSSAGPSHYRRYYGKDDAPALFWRASTLMMNPFVPKRVIEEARERDPASAAAEYDAVFRTDVESFVSREVLEACVARGRHELPPIGGLTYYAFTDPSGGSSDSMTMAIAHRDGDRSVIDIIREVTPPFSPESVVAEFATLLKTYRISSVTSDRYGGLWVAERFRAHGITCSQAAKPKSDLYHDMLPVLNSGSVELLDHPKAIAQIASLERRTARGGRDSIDHAPGAHDDISNAVAGAICGTAIAQGGAEGWLEYYRRLNEQADNAAPTKRAFGFEIAPQARRLYRVRVPGKSPRSASAMVAPCRCRPSGSWKCRRTTPLPTARRAGNGSRPKTGIGILPKTRLRLDCKSAPSMTFKYWESQTLPADRRRTLSRLISDELDKEGVAQP